MLVVKPSTPLVMKVFMDDEVWTFGSSMEVVQFMKDRSPWADTMNEMLEMGMGMGMGMAKAVHMVDGVSSGGSDECYYICT
ncbi:MAG: hypothetical protein MMC33_006548 [Icmadophila ericetorum]|nr:hypothetical protein [Icmadophila ericetorum]